MSVFARFRNTLRVNRVFTPARILILSFLLIILAGTFLLGLPLSARGGERVSFTTALFTAVSATCITGLTVVDTLTTWTTFGHIVILLLIQVGGLGLMTVMAISFYALGKKIGLSQRLLIMASLNLREISGIVKLIRHIFIGTFAAEALGALILWIRFSTDYSILDALGLGIFHAVSAFCNAGFDLFGSANGGSSLAPYAADPVVTATVCALVLMGSIGFFVWQDFWQKRKFSTLHVHSKLVLSVTLILFLAGWLFFCASEFNNPATLGAHSIPEKLTLGLFQSVNARSSGLSYFQQSDLNGASKLLTMILMFIGGSAGSAGGGIKNVTAAILFLSALSSLRGRSRVSVFKRTIPNEQVLSALAITLLALFAVFVSSFAIYYIEKLDYFDILFETVSAMATTGYSTGITPHLGAASRFIVIMLMFFGRVGIMTIGMASIIDRGNIEKTKYPDSWVLLG